MLIPAILLCLSSTAHAQLKTPDAVNGLKIRPNPTATISKVCKQLGKKDYPVSLHADCYSEAKQAVVVMVGGKAKGYTSEAIAKFVLSELEKAYVPAAAYLRNPEWDGVGMTFLLNGYAYGPYSGENWREGLETVKKHAPEAWFKH